MVANWTTWRPTSSSCAAAAGSEQLPPSNIPATVLIPAPSGVGQPRNEWTIERKVASVLPVACQP